MVGQKSGPALAGPAAPATTALGISHFLDTNEHKKRSYIGHIPLIITLQAIGPKCWQSYRSKLKMLGYLLLLSAE